MNKVHISIPEFDEAGLTYEECFRMIFVFIKHEVSHLKIYTHLIALMI